MKPLDVLIIGRNCVDYISVVERFPMEDEKVALGQRLMEGGGQGGTSACCVSRLGGSTALITSVGDDERGRYCLQRLNDFNVDTRYVEIIENAQTPLAYIFVNRGNGKRTIIYEPSQLPDLVLPKSLDSLLYSAKTLSLDPQTTTLGKEIKERIHPEAKLVYDCERWKDGLEDMMDIADFFIPSSAFFDSVPNLFTSSEIIDNIAKLDNMTRGQLIVTHGAGGAYYPLDASLFLVAAPEIDVVDTTGAGDNFHAAFALSISRGFDLHSAVKFSVAVASLSCQAYGGRNAVPTVDQALALSRGLRTRKISHTSST